MEGGKGDEQECLRIVGLAAVVTGFKAEPFSCPQ
jgi:hypothetical protein